MIFDTHAHYDDKQFDQDREELLVSMKDNGIGTIVDVGSNMETSAWIVDAVNRYPMMYGAVGVHPSDTAELKESDIDTLKKYAAMDRILAIGEIGLDYYWDEPEREIQKKWFEAQIELAREVRLPIIIHSRDAAKDTYDIMKSLHAEDIGGVVHCFSYSKEMARQFLDMGFYIGIGGVVTFKNAKTLKEVACGETVKVKKLTGVGAVKRRIMDMGITKGTDVLVRKVAPLGDPIEVSVRGYELSLRKADAEMIEVE